MTVGRTAQGKVWVSIFNNIVNTIQNITVGRTAQVKVWGTGLNLIAGWCVTPSLQLLTNPTVAFPHPACTMTSPLPRPLPRPLPAPPVSAHNFISLSHISNILRYLYSYGRKHMRSETPHRTENVGSNGEIYYLFIYIFGGQRRRTRIDGHCALVGNSSISAMQPPCYSLLEETVILGVIYGSLVWRVCNHAALVSDARPQQHRRPLRPRGQSVGWWCAPTPPAGSQHSCQPTVKLNILPLVWIFLWEIGSTGAQGAAAEQQLGFTCALVGKVWDDGARVPAHPPPPHPVCWHTFISFS